MGALNRRFSSFLGSLCLSSLTCGDLCLLPSGTVSLDGHDIRQLNPVWLRSKIGTVSQVGRQASLSLTFVGAASPVLFLSLIFVRSGIEASR